MLVHIHLFLVLLRNNKLIICTMNYSKLLCLIKILNETSTYELQNSLTFSLPSVKKGKENTFFVFKYDFKRVVHSRLADFIVHFVTFYMFCPHPFLLYYVPLLRMSYFFLGVDQLNPFGLYSSLLLVSNPRKE